MDTIFLRDFRIRTIVGIWEWERRMPQIVSIDLDIGTDIRRAARSDQIEDTLNYKAVTQRVKSLVADSGFNLIETMAEQIAVLIIDEFGAPWVRVAVHKPWAIRGSRDVGVVIERGSRE